MEPFYLFIYFVNKVVEKLMELARKRDLETIKTLDSFRFFDILHTFSQSKRKIEINSFDVSQVKHLIQEFSF